MRSRGDPHVAASDLRKRLAGRHVGAQRDEIRRRVAVVDEPPAIGPAVDAHDWSVRTEAGYPLAHDRPRGDRDLNRSVAARAIRGGDVDPLVVAPSLRPEDERLWLDREHPGCASPAT